MNVYINLSVGDLARSRAFFSALGFSFDERFCGEDAMAMKINDTAGVMLLTREKFAGFTPRAVADSTAVSETLIALQLDDRAEVDAMVAEAVRRGGSEPRPPLDHGFMYQRSFADPDGHLFEPFVMDTDQMENAR